MDGRPTRERMTLAQLVDLVVQLHRDGERTDAVLRQRDRAIGREWGGKGLDPPRKLAAWLTRVRDASAVDRGHQAEVAVRVGALLLGVLGLVLGWGAAAAVFYYDGTRPVNVVTVLAVFVVLQVVLLAGLAVAMTPAAGGLGEALRFLMPGRLLYAVTRLLPQEHREALAEVRGRATGHQRQFGQVQRWLIAWASQVFAVAFNAGALLGALYLIVFSDLAFAWSTTLDVDAATFHGITQALALPWSWAFVDASPSADLVALTRYYRMQPGVLDAAVAGGWWPFVIAAMVTYGLLPRLVTLGVSRWRLSRAVHDVAMRLPGVQGVLDRLDSELVETRSPEPEETPALVADGAPAPRLAVGGRACDVINWSGVPVEDAALSEQLGAALAVRPGSVVHAGGARSLEQDRQAIADVARRDGDRCVAIVVKAWEPPLLELLDFLGELRRSVGDARPVMVVTVAVDERGRLAPPQARHVAPWRQRLRTLGDPWLGVQPLGAEARP